MENKQTIEISDGIGHEDVRFVGDNPQLLTEADALPRNVAHKQEYPTGVSMNTEDGSNLYEDEYDELDFEQDKFQSHKGGRGRTKGEIAENHRPDPSGNVRKAVTNMTNGARNQREPQIAHHSPNYYETLAANQAATAQAEADKKADEAEKEAAGRAGKHHHHKDR